MNTDDLIKAAPAIAKVAGPLAAAIPFTAIVKRILGPAADELAEMWKDQVRMYRYERQLKCVQKAEEMAKKAGFEPQAVPPKILFPLLEGASMEDDEDLHTMWAALLANAASPETADKVRPGFVAILKQMSSDEARLLEFMYDRLYGDIVHASLGQIQDPGDYFDNSLSIDVAGLLAAYSDLNTDRGTKKRCYLAMDGLISAQVITRHHIEAKPGFCVTARGIAFIEVCRPPKPPR